MNPINKNPAGESIYTQREHQHHEAGRERVCLSHKQQFPCLNKSVSPRPNVIDPRASGQSIPVAPIPHNGMLSRLYHGIDKTTYLLTEMILDGNRNAQGAINGVADRR